MPHHSHPSPVSLVAPSTPSSNMKELPSVPHTRPIPSSSTVHIFSTVSLPLGPPLVPLPTSQSPRSRPIQVFLRKLKVTKPKVQQSKTAESSPSVSPNQSIPQEEWRSQIDWSPLADLFDVKDAHSLGFIKGAYGTPSFEDTSFTPFPSSNSASPNPHFESWHKIIVQRETTTRTVDLR
ncbi:hypothetical protein P7C70_g7191, partial [Phenoliferia sp. Uapishka_3]